MKLLAFVLVTVTSASLLGCTEKFVAKGAEGIAADNAVTLRAPSAVHTIVGQTSGAMPEYRLIARDARIFDSVRDGWRDPIKLAPGDYIIRASAIGPKGIEVVLFANSSFKGGHTYVLDRTTCYLIFDLCSSTGPGFAWNRITLIDDTTGDVLAEETGSIADKWYEYNQWDQPRE